MKFFQVFIFFDCLSSSLGDVFLKKDVIFSKQNQVKNLSYLNLVHLLMQQLILDQKLHIFVMNNQVDCSLQRPVF